MSTLKLPSCFTSMYLLRCFKENPDFLMHSQRSWLLNRLCRRPFHHPQENRSCKTHVSCVLMRHGLSNHLTRKQVSWAPCCSLIPCDSSEKEPLMTSRVELARSHLHAPCSSTLFLAPMLPSARRKGEGILFIAGKFSASKHVKGRMIATFFYFCYRGLFISLGRPETKVFSRQDEKKKTHFRGSAKSFGL